MWDVLGVLDRWPLHPVLKEVCIERRFLGGTVWAEHTSVWLLACVGADVGFENALV